MEIDTHGRWPIVGALGLVPVTALAARRRPGLRPLAALLWHQTEEWVWPGAFLPWINREVLGSDEDEFPIDRRLGFLINVVLGWGFSLASMAGARAAGSTAFLYATHFGNAALHTAWAVRHRRYDPGSVTALLTLTPVAVSGLYRLSVESPASGRAVRVGAIGGITVSAALVPVLRLRTRRGLASTPGSPLRR